MFGNNIPFSMKYLFSAFNTLYLENEKFYLGWKLTKKHLHNLVHAITSLNGELSLFNTLYIDDLELQLVNAETIIVIGLS